MTATSGRRQSAMVAIGDREGGRAGGAEPPLATHPRNPPEAERPRPVATGRLAKPGRNYPLAEVPPAAPLVGTVLVALDEGSILGGALAYGVGIARRAKASLRLLPMVTPAGATGRPREADQGAAESSESPSGSIVRAVERARPDLVVMAASKDRTDAAPRVPAVAEYVVRSMGVPVLLAPPGLGRVPVPPPRPLRRILVALDGIRGAEVAVAWSSTLAMILQGHVTLYQVVEPDPDDLDVPNVKLEERRQSAARYLDGLADQIRARGVPSAAYADVGSYPAKRIVESLERRYDMAVMVFGTDSPRDDRDGEPARAVIGGGGRPVVLVPAAAPPA